MINAAGNRPLNIAQFSDCHLFADINAQHYGANVYQNLLDVLKAIAADKRLDFIVFTGDLSQDRSLKSYQRFVDAVNIARITIPIYYVPGNHDDLTVMATALTPPPFINRTLIEFEQWQVYFINSKSGTPAGFVDTSQFEWLAQTIKKDKTQLLFMHHHPVDAGYFIDRHGLQNKAEFWQRLSLYPSIKAIACGHIHQGMMLVPPNTNTDIKIYACPATSIQFDPHCNTLKALDCGPGYRRFCLSANGMIDSESIYLDD